MWNYNGLHPDKLTLHNILTHASPHQHSVFSYTNILQLIYSRMLADKQIFLQIEFN